SFMAGKDSGHVLPYQPTGPIACNDRKVGESEVAPWVSQASTKSRDAEGLAGGASNENVDCCIRPLAEAVEITEIRNGWIVMRQHGTREGVDLGEECRAPPER